MKPASPVQSPGRLWTADFVLNLLAGHFLFASYSALLTIVPPYVLERGGREWQIGVVVGSFGVVSVLVRPFAGRWVYSVGAKGIAVAGTGIFAVAGLLYIPDLGLWSLVAVRMLQGIGLAMAPVATTTIVANLAPAPRRAEAMAYMGNSIGVSGLYAPVLGYWLLTRSGFPASFIFSAACALLGCIAALGLSSARTRVPLGREATKGAPLVSRAALFPTAVFLTFTLTTAPVSTFLPLLAEERHLGNPGLYFTVNSFVSIPVMFVGGPIADRLGRGATIIPGLLLTALSMFVLVAASGQLTFLAAAVAAGAGFGLLQPGIQSLTVDRVTPRERSSALATLQAAWDIGGSGGAFLLGPVAGALSVAATFGIVGVGTLLGAAGFVVGNARSPAVLPGRGEARASEDGRG